MASVQVLAMVTEKTQIRERALCYGKLVSLIRDQYMPFSK